ncbi:hypothetical protein T09_1109 [Trichinella sp. T9]|nr:hypothetical protein T09_1109 [Trichinella sp. T9]
MKRKRESAVDAKQNAYGMKLNNKREKLIRLVTSNRLSYNSSLEKFILSKKFQCTKTGFERCAMQITIAIKVPYRQ